MITGVIATVVTAAMAFWFWTVDMSQPVQQLPIVGTDVALTSPLERFGFTLQMTAGSIPILAGTMGLAALSFFLSLRTSARQRVCTISLGHW